MSPFSSLSPRAFSTRPCRSSTLSRDRADRTREPSSSGNTMTTTRAARAEAGGTVSSIATEPRRLPEVRRRPPPGTEPGGCRWRRRPRGPAGYVLQASTARPLRSVSTSSPRRRASARHSRSSSSAWEKTGRLYPPRFASRSTSARSLIIEEAVIASHRPWTEARRRGCQARTRAASRHGPPRRCGAGEVGAEDADERGELRAVAGARGDDGEGFPVREHEVLGRRGGEEAGGLGVRLGDESWQVLIDVGDEPVAVGGVDLPVLVVGGGERLPRGVLRELRPAEPRVAATREAVGLDVVRLVDERRPGVAAIAVGEVEGLLLRDRRARHRRDET